MSTFTADTADDLTVDGPSARFTYRRLGPQGGVPLILVQRFRGTIDWWDPEFLDYLSVERDVILFDNVGIGYTSGDPRDSVEGFADGAIEFIDALGLSTVDLLGWSLGGIVAQAVTNRRPGLVRKLIVAGSSPVGPVPGQPDMNQDVVAIMAKEESTTDDLLFLFYPDTEAARTRGVDHLKHVSTRLAAGGPQVTEEAAMGQLHAVAKILATPFENVRTSLEAIKQPVLYANGVHDVMIPAIASYVAVQHLDDATLLLYSDAGHAFLFQHARAFSTQVANFLND
jgi:pimeloyl-ACP methyl ester carboxylesterase